MENNTELLQTNFEIEPILKFHKINNFEQLNHIRMAGDSEQVEMGGLVNINKIDSDTLYSFGANPCLAGVVQTKNGNLFMFHSNAEELTSDQEEIIKTAKTGIIGGELSSLKIFKSDFPKSTLKIVSPLDRKSDFNIVYVKKNNPSSVAPGIYYCYDQLNY